jgi:hypothetical protein
MHSAMRPVDALGHNAPRALDGSSKDDPLAPNR